VKIRSALKNRIASMIPRRVAGVSRVVLADEWQAVV